MQHLTHNTSRNPRLNLAEEVPHHIKAGLNLVDHDFGKRPGIAAAGLAPASRADELCACEVN